MRNRGYLVGAGVIVIAVFAFAGTTPDFSGTYTSVAKKRNKSDQPTVLRVVQTETTVQVTQVQGDKEITNKFALDGSEGEYLTQGGQVGKGSAKRKGEALVLDTIVETRIDQTKPQIRFHTRETWRLARDNKSLTIKTEVEALGVPAGISAAVFPDNGWTETYRRTDKP